MKKHGMTKRICSAAMAVTVLVTTLFSGIMLNPQEVHAFVPLLAGSGSIGSITLDGTTTEYRDYSDMNEALKGYEGRNITIEMLSDWDAASGTDIDSPLVIPTGSVTALNMNGHMINRDLTRNNGSISNGEVILVQTGASFTINGGDKEVQHDGVYVYKSTNDYELPKKTAGIKGALITGGASTDTAGGIHALKDSKISVYDVTIAGCRAYYGGGVRMNDSGFSMFDSEITGCIAAFNGGGIYSTGTLDDIILNNSIIDKNYSFEYGGGICLANNTSMVNGLWGKGDSFISDNASTIYGGGVAMLGAYNTVIGVIVNNNRARYGGGIYVGGEFSDVSNVTAENNRAETAGGGICYDGHAITEDFLAEYFKDRSKDSPLSFYARHSLEESVITGNSAADGGGIFFDVDIANEKINVKDQAGSYDVYIHQTLNLGYGVVKVMSNNTYSHNSHDNLYMAHDDWERVRVYSQNMDEGSYVGISYCSDADNITLTPPDEKESAKKVEYLFSDQPKRSFKYDSGTGTYIRFVNNEASVPSIPVRVKSENANSAWKSVGDATGGSKTKAGKVGTINAGGYDGGINDYNKDYDLIRMFYSHENISDVEVTYYSDGLFYEKPEQYNVHLATLTWPLAFAGGYLNGGDVNNKHAAARQFLADIGCPDDMIHVNDCMLTVPTGNTIGVTMGSKKLRMSDGSETGDVLIPVTVRGLGYEMEWMSNVTLGLASEMKGNEAKGFAEAADKVFNEIIWYLDNYGLRDDYEEGHVKFWVTGFSRAGATANLTCRRLVDSIYEDCKGEKKSEVFGYTCEAPKGGTDKGETLDPENYYCIHNMINCADIVPLVAPGEMGFKRYGVDHYIPGSEASDPSAVKKTVTDVKRGGTGGPTQVTTYADNEPYLTKTDEYNAQKEEMLNQLRSLDKDAYVDDYFMPMYLILLEQTGLISFSLMNWYSYGNSDNRVEDFITDFIRYLQEGVKPDEVGHWSQVVPSRDVYVSKKKINGTEHPSIETGARDLMGIFFGESKSTMNAFMSKAEKVKDMIGYGQMLELYSEVLPGYYKMDEDDREYWCNYLLERLEKAGAIDELSPANAKKLREDFPTLCDALLRYVNCEEYDDGSFGAISWAKPVKNDKPGLTYTATMLKHSDAIINNHFPIVNIGWARTYDDWYEDEFVEYELEAPSSVGAPGVWAKTMAPDGSENTIRLESGETYILSGDVKIYMDDESVSGEAIYYDRSYEGDITSSNVTGQLYQFPDGLSLPTSMLPGEFGMNVRFDVYEMSYGVKGQTDTYNILLLNNDHKVTVSDKHEYKGERSTEYTFTEGEEVILEAPEPDGEYLKSWKITMTSPYNETEVDVTSDLIEDPDNSTLIFRMPVARTDSHEKWPVGYELKIRAEYGKRVDMVWAFDEFPQAGDKLPDSYEIGCEVFGVDEKGEAVTFAYPVSWFYLDDDGKKMALPNTMEHIAYNETVYIAEITIPQNKEKGLVFEAQVGGVSNAKWAKGMTAGNKFDRNAVDGSVTISIQYDATGTEGTPRPEYWSHLTVNLFDMNLGGDVPGTTPVEYTVYSGGEVSITAPTAEDERFDHWELSSSGCELVEGELKEKTIKVKVTGEDAKIRACYIPVIKEVNVQLKNTDGSMFSPTTGAFATDCVPEMTVTITNTFEIHPDNLQVTWTPDVGSSGRFAALKSYSATVKVVPDDNGMIKARIAGSDGDYNETRIIILPADNVKVFLNNKPGTENTDNDGSAADASDGSEEVVNEGSIGTPDDVTSVTWDADNNSVTGVFKAGKYTLKEIYPIADVTGIANGATKEEINALLPDHVTVKTSNGVTEEEKDLSVTWSKPTKVSGTEDEREASVWKTDGTINLPDYMENSNGLPLNISLKVYVDEAPRAAVPIASLNSGTYLYNQVTTLSTAEANATIRYTTDGTDPTKDSPAYDGSDIYVGRDRTDLVDVYETDNEGNAVKTGKKKLVIKAFTEAEGKWDSNVMTYEYVIDNEVPVPTDVKLTYNGEYQTGVAAGLYYTLAAVSEGVIIDGQGNATAKDVGTYQVSASLREPDKFCWSVSDGGEASITTADQIVTFVIEPASGGSGGGGGSAASTTIYPAGKELTYSGTAQELVIPGTSDAGTFMYAVGTKRSQIPDASEFGKTVPTGTDPGIYYVWYVLRSDDAEEITNPVRVESYIDKIRGSIRYGTFVVQKFTGDADFTNILTNAGDGEVTYFSSNTEVAWVNPTTGVVKVLSAGKAVITAYVDDGKMYAYENRKTSYNLYVNQVDVDVPEEFDPFTVQFDESIITGDPYTGLSYNVDEKRYETAYIGAPIKPAVIVTGADRILTEGVDYTVSYSNNVNYNAKNRPALVIVKGKGDYSGKKSLEFYVTQADLKEAQRHGQIGIGENQAVITGAKFKPVMAYRGYQLKTADYVLSSSAAVKEDTTIGISGKGNFTGSIDGIRVKALSKQEVNLKTIKVSLNAKQHVYNGSPQILSADELVVSAGGSRLNENEGYKTLYSSNTEAGTAKVLIYGIGDYTGSVVRTFKIKPDTGCEIKPEVFMDESVYSPAGASPFIMVCRKIAGEDDEYLTEGKDYKITLSNNKTAGKGKGRFKITFMGNYKGHAAISEPFDIAEADLSAAKICAADLIYNKPGKYFSVPVVTLDGIVLGTKNYTLKYFDEGNNELTAGTTITLEDGEDFKTITIKAYGRGSCTGETVDECTYRIVRPKTGAINLTKAKVVAAEKNAKGNYMALAAQEYNGQTVSPAVKVIYKDGKEWKEVPEEYISVSFANNVLKGKAKILVTGDGTHAVGSKMTSFTIKARNVSGFILK